MSALLICGVIGSCGPSREPIACGYGPGHVGDHSWATLPTFVDGLTLLERAAIEYITASRAEADRAARTGRMADPKAAEWERKQDALAALILAVDERRSAE